MDRNPRRKRSSSLVLTSLMAGTAMSITACDSQPSIGQWQDPPAASRPVDVQSFKTLQECQDSGLSADVCSTALAQAQGDQADHPRYDNAQSCEDKYGVGQCVPRSDGGGSFFTPLLTGFLVGQALNGGGYRGAPIYRDRDGDYYSGGGAVFSRDYVTGRTQVSSDAFGPPARSAPTRVQSRSSVISRGGFGGGSRSFGG